MSKPDPNSMLNLDALSDMSGNEYGKALQWAYSKVLDANGMNMLDPIAANLKWFNIHQKRSMIDPPYVGRTYLFMTRPDCNFEYKPNIARVPLFQYFSSTRIGRTLMEYLMHPEFGGIYSKPSVAKSDNYPREDTDTQDGGDGLLVSNSPFIPLVTNLCTETSGAKDLILETHETEQDYAGNRLVYGAGMDEIESIGEISLNYDDSYFSPALFLNLIWSVYIHNLSKGTIMTRRMHRANRIIDYTCSIYIFMTDLDGQTITRWCKYTGVFPRTVPFGAVQHTSDPNIEALRKFSISYSYNRYEPMAPAVLVDFNKLTAPLIPKSLGGLGYVKSGLDSVPYKIVDNPFGASDENDKMRNWWGGVPFILGNKLLFVRPNESVK